MKNFILLASFLVFPLTHADETKTICGRVKNLEINDHLTTSKFEIGSRHFEINTQYKTLSIQALIAARVSDTKVCVNYYQNEDGKNIVQGLKL